MFNNCTVKIKLKTVNSCRGRLATPDAHGGAISDLQHNSYFIPSVGPAEESNIKTKAVLT